jgi:hypothetical protein
MTPPLTDAEVEEIRARHAAAGLPTDRPLMYRGKDDTVRLPSGEFNAYGDELYGDTVARFVYDEEAEFNGVPSDDVCNAWLFVGPDVGRLLATLDERTRERDEMAATLANERGEGEPPSPGWTFDFVWRDGTPVDFGWHKEAAYVESGAHYDEGGWRLRGVTPGGRYPTARAAMKAADAALAADGGGRG